VDLGVGEECEMSAESKKKLKKGNFTNNQRVAYKKMLKVETLGPWIPYKGIAMRKYFLNEPLFEKRKGADRRNVPKHQDLKT